MGKKKTTTETTTKERALVSRERRLALALRAVLDAVQGTSEAAIANECGVATTTLIDLGYEQLEGIPKRLANLNAHLTKAVAMGDGKEIARLGLELERAKAGRMPLAVNGGAEAGGES
jgi:hypothetical protein